MAGRLLSPILRRQATSAIATRSVNSNSVRWASTDATSPDPKTKAASLIDALPGNNVVSKTGFITLGTGAAAWAVSKELFVVNEEVVILGSFAVLISYIYSAAREPYTKYANGIIQKINNTLSAARKEHTEAVRSRIDNVSGMKDVVDVTKALFALSKETAKLEHESFILRQRVQLANEIRSTLDSWVRFESQARDNEQRELVKSVIDKVLKDLKDPKLQRDILQQSVTEIEALVKSKDI